jgi:hypothetical protein
MPETLEGFIWETATTLSRHAIEYARRRAERANGLDQPPPASPYTLSRQASAPPRLPEPPRFEPPRFKPPAWRAPWDESPASGPQATVRAEADSQRAGIGASAAPADAAAYSYADEVEAGTACAKCTHGHLRTMAAAAGQAHATLLGGDAEASRRFTARVAAEAAVLREFDWTPKKVRNTPPAERRLVEAAQPCVADALRQLDGPPKEVVLAWGSVDEAVRFARSPRQTERDRQEIEWRLRRYYDVADLAERVLAAPALRADVAERQARRDAARHLREARHVLERADPYSADALEEASAHLEAAAVALTPTPDPDRARALAQICRHCRSEFEDGFLDEMRHRRDAVQAG